jgi:hypothetical protein
MEISRLVQAGMKYQPAGKREKRVFWVVILRLEWDMKTESLKESS